MLCAKTTCHPLKSEADYKSKMFKICQCVKTMFTVQCVFQQVEYSGTYCQVLNVNYDLYSWNMNCDEPATISECVKHQKCFIKLFSECTHIRHKSASTYAQNIFVSTVDEGKCVYAI